MDRIADPVVPPAISEPSLFVRNPCPALLNVYPFVLSWSLLEAMSAGCTLVASRTAPVEEVITHGKNGHLVDFFDPQALAEKLDEVLDKNRGSTTIREQARRTVVSRFDWNGICLPRHLELLGLGRRKRKPVKPR